MKAEITIKDKIGTEYVIIKLEGDGDKVTALLNVADKMAKEWGLVVK